MRTFIKKLNIYSAIVSLTGILLLVGCAQRQGELFQETQGSLVWPEAPDEARIKYIGSVSTENDLKRGHSWWEGFGAAFFGKEKIGVLVNPYSIAVDDDERLYVGDTAGNVIHVFDLSTREYKQFSSMPIEKLSEPVALILVDDLLYIVDSVLGKVCVFDKNGEFRFCFGDEKLERPVGIAVSADSDKIYVVDTARHLVAVFAKDGKFINEFGSRGIGKGQFNFPTHIAVNKKGQLYVSDTLNYRIQIFNDQGQFISMFGLQGDRPGNFAHPSGLAFDSQDRLYIVDRQFENVQIFNDQKQLLLAFGQEGSEAGQFWLPSGICVNKSRIYVADSFNKRVQIFELLKKTE